MRCVGLFFLQATASLPRRSPAKSAGADGWAFNSFRPISLLRQPCGQLRSQLCGGVCNELRETNAANCAASNVQLRAAGSADTLPAGFFSSQL
jgi:hypothetical protein